MDVRLASEHITWIGQYSSHTYSNSPRIRHVKCDETSPHCQRCVSTGRICDGYNRASPERAYEALLSRECRSLSRMSPSEDIQEQRSFEFFRTATLPNISGIFGLPAWKLVLQACEKERALSQSVIALGALYERYSASHSNSTVTNAVPIETSFPLRQYSRSLLELRDYLASKKELDINIILMCALVHISIEVVQNNHANALIHLENALKLLRDCFQKAKPAMCEETNKQSVLDHADVDASLARTFVNLDLHASIYQGMRLPAMSELYRGVEIPGRFSSLDQAKSFLDALTGQLYLLIRGITEEYKFRKLSDLPIEQILIAQKLEESFDTWDDRFEKYLNRSTSRFSRQEQTVINILIINHRICKIQAATCTKDAAVVFDRYDEEFDQVTTLAALVIHERKSDNPHIQQLSLDIGVIQPLYFTATKCREHWIRHRALSLLKSIKFQEGVWNAVIMAAVASIAINKEQEYTGDGFLPDERPPEIARIHSIGTDIDLVKRVSEVVLSRKLQGLDGPWTADEEYISW